MRAARFIVMEGPDGSGTTLHSRLLAERLSRMGREVVLTAEPSDGTVGRHIRVMLSGGERMDPATVQLLFCADRADHVARVIAPALARGATVITDRYVLSTLVYGSAAGLDAAWLAEINGVFPQPDLTVLALPPLAVCLERLARRARRDAFEQEALQRAVYEQYRTMHPADAVLIDTSGDKTEVAERLWNMIETRIAG